MFCVLFLKTVISVSLSPRHFHRGGRMKTVGLLYYIVILQAAAELCVNVYYNNKSKKTKDINNLFPYNILELHILCSVLVSVFYTLYIEVGVCIGFSISSDVYRYKTYLPICVPIYFMFNSYYIYI